MHRSRIIFLSIIICLTNQFCMAQHWAPLGSGPNLQVEVLFADSIDHLIYMGGGGWIGLPNYHSIAKWDGTSWDSLSHGMYQNAPVKAITRFQNEIYVGVASFEPIIGINSPCIIKWNGSSWSAVGNGIGGPPFSFYPDGDTLFIAGGFDSVNHIENHMVTSWNGTSFSNLNCHYQGIAVVTKFDNQLYICGSIVGFDSSGVHGLSVARQSGIGWGVYGGNVLSSAVMGREVVYNNKLYLAGNFTTTSGNADNGIMAWNGMNWESVGGGVDGYINCFQVFNNKLYVGGYFDHAGGVPAKNIAYWDGSKWCGLGSDFNHQIHSMAVLDNELYVGGGFTVIDGDSINYVAKWIGGNFTDTCGIINGVNNLTAELNEITIYPNPATSTVTLQLPNTNKQATVTVLDLSGKQVLQFKSEKREEEIDMTTLPRGMYFITVQTDDGVWEQKVVLQ